MFLSKIAEAQTSAAGSNAGQLLQKVVQAVVNPIITLFFIMALSIFTYGVFEFIKGSDNEEVRRKGQKHMMSGIIGLFIMTAVFAIIQVLQNFVGEFGTPTDLWILN
jgi:thiol:disulfide interchange protein